MSRHHPVKVSFRAKSKELTRLARVVCQCGCVWEQHTPARTPRPCGRCGCAAFRLPHAPGGVTRNGGPDD
jgi:hypothetical protein